MRFGLVGAGEIGRVRADALRRSPSCRLAAVADVAPDRARAAARVSTASVYTDYRQLLDQSDLDAVIVSTPPDIHEEVAMAALERGKHVLCEKPFAPTLDACRRLLRTARRSGLTLATGFNQRYFPAIKFVRHTVESGEIGELSFVRAFTGHTGLSEFREPWMHERARVGGGAFMDNGLHLIDLIDGLLGEVTEVFGLASGRVWRLDSAEDNGFALMRNRQGAVASLHASWTEWTGYRFFIEAYGDRGMVRASYAPMFSKAIYLKKPGVVRRRRFNFYPSVALREAVRGWKSTVLVAFQEELRDFVRLVGGETAALADGVAGCRAVGIVHALYESARTRAAVNVADMGQVED